MTEKEYLELMLKTLNLIEVKGFNNLNYLAGAIQATQQRLNELKGEENGNVL